MPKDRAKPRISISKLAEYLVASAGRRRTILRDQKYPPPFKAANFTHAYPAIADVLLRGCEPGVADAYVAAWREQLPRSKSPIAARTLKLCIEAMSAFKALAATTMFKGLVFAPGLREAYVQRAGVLLSIRPELLLSGPSPGALKVYLGKTTPLSRDADRKMGSGGYAATALHLWAESQFGGARAENCLVLDVFAGSLFRAPSRHVKRRGDIDSACEEIGAVWASLQPSGATSHGSTAPGER